MILWNCGAPPNASQAASGQTGQSVPSGLVGCSEMQFSQLLLAVRIAPKNSPLEKLLATLFDAIKCLSFKKNLPP